MPIPDALDMWEARERQIAKEEEKYPVCEHCGYPITEDDLFDFHGVLYHIYCAEEEFKKSTEDYIC